MSKATFKLNHDSFIPWLFSESDKDEILGYWMQGGSAEEYAINSAGYFPLNHIENWEDIKHHYTKEEQEMAEEEYEVQYIPDDLKVEWIYEAQDDE
jgi:hypothetical protein